MAIAEKNIVDEVIEVFRSLPPDKARSVLDYANYLADRADEQEWDRISAKAATSPKFKTFVEEVEREIAEGKATPMDPDQL